MVWLSIRLVRTALIASVTALGTTYAAPTLAQVPVYQAPEPEPEPEPEPGVSSPPVPAAVAPAPAAPGLLSSRTPPAKTNVITTPQAPADENEAEDQAEDARLGPRRHWYGWQTLAADGASLAALTLVVALSTQDRSRNVGNLSGLAWFGALGYELAPGIIHFVHRNPGRGFASMGLRLGLPLAGAFLGASAASGCSGGFACEAGGVGLGALVGMTGAIAIDAAVLAYDDAPATGSRGLSLTPLVSVTQRQAWVGFAGNL
jgi:hypothetical protein